MIQLTDDDLLLRLADTEDSFIERKTQNDLGDCLKTAVAFANSTPVGYPAIMFVGVKDTGEVEGVTNPDKVQRSVSERIAKAYPPIYTLTRVLAKDGKSFLAVVIPGSENRPHFAGPAYIRDGSKSVPSSEDQFRTLIAQRNDKARMILQWQGKDITLEIEYMSHFAGMEKFGTWVKETTVTAITAVILDCNPFYVTFQGKTDSSIVPEHPFSCPLSPLEISFDHKNERLMLSRLKIPG